MIPSMYTKEGRNKLKRLKKHEIITFFLLKMRRRDLKIQKFRSRYHNTKLIVRIYERKIKKVADQLNHLIGKPYSK